MCECVTLLANDHTHHLFTQVEGQWHTWIDYPEFHRLAAEHRETGAAFSSLDYMAPTPDWAVFGAKERGFDPDETRWKRKQKAKKDVGGC